MAAAVWTLDDLASGGGGGGGGGDKVYLAVGSKVFDVSSSRQFYGPGGPYAALAGREVAFALSTGSLAGPFNVQLPPGVAARTADTLAGWLRRLEAKYTVIATLDEAALGELSEEEAEAAVAAAGAAAPPVHHGHGHGHGHGAGAAAPPMHHGHGHGHGHGNGNGKEHGHGDGQAHAAAHTDAKSQAHGRAHEHAAPSPGPAEAAPPATCPLGFGGGRDASGAVCPLGFGAGKRKEVVGAGLRSFSLDSLRAAVPATFRVYGGNPGQDRDDVEEPAEGGALPFSVGGKVLDGRPALHLFHADGAEAATRPALHGCLGHDISFCIAKGVAASAETLDAPLDGLRFEEQQRLASKTRTLESALPLLGYLDEDAQSKLFGRAVYGATP
eukprot:CAMPEP_0118868828 /NCGR_PEP_ID=MMETSP1163-20130328/12297_1 /TAXON_ID=124430 /ORGANISM="Phaeomonas parva, Strain CCMP2877" /LENGTH=384 /DNA_ID=CAMNT_0006803609 /DNA_START=265 /DNA_END=1419 /DNA_ORIENTATION=-